MDKLKKYNPEIVKEFGVESLEMVEDKDGDYVLLSDVEELIKSLQIEIQFLHRQLR